MAERFEGGHALLIGVGRSRHPPWSLPVTADDVRALATVLVDPDHCGYPSENVTCLLDEATTRSGIVEALASLARRSAERPDITVLVYYSGHGWLDGAGGYFLIPHDVDPDDLPATALASGKFTDALRGIRSRRLLVALDTCHAAGMAEAKGAPGSFTAPPKGQLDRLLEGSGRAVLSSCRGAQKSWIFPAGLSIFTHHLIEALRGEECPPGQEVVRLLDVLLHVSARVEASAYEIGREQTPYLKIDADNFPLSLVTRHRRGKEPGERPAGAFIHELLEGHRVRESWQVLFELLRPGAADLAPSPPAPAIAASRQIFGALSLGAPVRRLEEAFWHRLREVRREGIELESADGMARAYLEAGHLLSSDGRLEPAFQARRLCRHFLEEGLAAPLVSERLRALQDGLVNCEAVAMRDEFQPRLAYHQLSEYDVPSRRALLYPEVCVLGTKAQLLTYLAETEEDRALAAEQLEEAEHLLGRVIGYLERSPGRQRELPRDYNYLGAVHGAAGRWAEMDRTFEESLRLNDRWFEELPARERRRSDHETWIRNMVFTFQLWLRHCDLCGDDRRFDDVDRRNRESWLRVAAATGRWDDGPRHERRYPAALVRRYRARNGARLLAPLRGTDVWEARVIRPLVELEECFAAQGAGDLAAAVLTDLLLVADPRRPEIGAWGRHAEALLEDLVRTSRRHWGEHALYREPFAAQLEPLAAFNGQRITLQQLRPALRRIRTVLAY